MWKFQKDTNIMAGKDVRLRLGGDSGPLTAFEAPQFGDNSNFAGRILKASLGAASSVNR